MRRTGQITLELTIIIFIAIAVIFNSLVLPLSHMSLRETESVGNSALAMKAVDSIANTANLVGISGDGAKDYVLIDTREEFEELYCDSTGGQYSIDLRYTGFQVDVLDIPNKPGIGLNYKGHHLNYTNEVDFDLDCSGLPSEFSLGDFKNEKVGICFENNAGTVRITDCTPAGPGPGPIPLSATIDSPGDGDTVPLTVDFIGSVLGGTAPYDYEWDFDGDTVIDSTTMDTMSSVDNPPSFTFPSAGTTYTVTLTVTDDNGVTAPATITVTTAAGGPIPIGSCEELQMIGYHSGYPVDADYFLENDIDCRPTNKIGFPSFHQNSLWDLGYPSWITKPGNADLIRQPGSYTGGLEHDDLNDWTSHGFKPIGYATLGAPEIFGGTINGNDYEIQYLYLHRGNSGMALIGTSNGATITNLHMTNINLTGEISQAGGIIGRGDCALTRCSVTGRIFSNELGSPVRIGGLIGDSDNFVITDCHNFASVFSSSGGKGGLVGTGNGVITDSHNEGAIEGGLYTGGLIGESNSIKIVNSYNTDSINWADYSGGLVGSVSGLCDIIDSYNTGSISGGTNVGDKLGGLLGHGSCTITHSYNTGDVTGSESYIGGLIGDGGSSVITKSYNTGNVRSGANPGTILQGIGGLVGSGFSQISESFNLGDVSANSFSGIAGNVGGLVGRGNGDIIDSYSTGSVHSNSGWGITTPAGGLIGVGSNPTITNSYSIGEVTSDVEFGALFGDSDSATISSSYWDRELISLNDCCGTGSACSSGSCMGGTGLLTLQMLVESTYVGWDFSGSSDSWTFDDGNPADNYPCHQWYVDEGGTCPT